MRLPWPGRMKEIISNLMAKFHRGVLDPTPVPISSSASINVEMEEDDSYDSPPSDVTELLQRKEPQISVNALTIVVGFRTMRIVGYHKKRPLHILIDSGNTHNFLDTQMEKNMGA